MLNRTPGYKTSIHFPDSLQIKPRKYFFKKVVIAAGLLFAGSLIGWQTNTLMTITKTAHEKIYLKL